MLNPTNEDSDLRSFFNYLFVEKGLSKNTVEAYRNDLNEYLKWTNLQQISDYKLITEPQINDFIASLFKKNLKLRIKVAILIMTLLLLQIKNLKNLLEPK